MTSVVKDMSLQSHQKLCKTFQPTEHPLLYSFHQARVWFVLSGLQGNTVDSVEEDLLSL